MKSLISCLALVFMCLPVQAGNNSSDGNRHADKASAVFTSTHRASIRGKTIRYKAVAGHTQIFNSKKEPCASIFSVSYFRTDTDNSPSRPVMFVFNGGPGSSSVWLHLGLFGPQRVVVPNDASDDGAAPFRLVNNTESLLDVTDLVMVDPVGAGFSHPLGRAESKDFWGLKQDADSIAQFIRHWLTEHNRWNSPKYLAGESYGTTRAAMLTESLHSGFQDVALNGVLLISSVLDFSTIRPNTLNTNTPISYLPTLAATAWYHGKVEGEESLEAFVDKAREFALTDYAVALHKGNRLSAAERAEVRKQLAHFTGLSERYLEQADLYLSPSRFRKELLRDRGVTIGRLDGRYLGEDIDNAGETPDADPSGYGVSAAYTAAINHYLQNQLKVESDHPYEILSVKANRNWDWSMNGSRFGGQNVDVAPKFGKELRQNKHYRIFVANGYYDLATPFLGTENSFAKMGMPQQRVTMKYYRAGHMMYVHQDSLEQLSEDIREFIVSETKNGKGGKR